MKGPVLSIGFRYEAGGFSSQSRCKAPSAKSALQFFQIYGTIDWQVHREGRGGALCPD